MKGIIGPTTSAGQAAIIVAMILQVLAKSRRRTETSYRDRF